MIRGVGHSGGGGGLPRDGCMAIIVLLAFGWVGYVVITLVERFDIEPYSDFSAKWPNFTGLVLLCIDAKFCK